MLQQSTLPREENQSLALECLIYLPWSGYNEEAPPQLIWVSMSRVGTRYFPTVPRIEEQNLSLLTTLAFLLSLLSKNLFLGFGYCTAIQHDPADCPSGRRGRL